jgi:predicted transglutaminase-like cysteine proteinase
MTFVCKLLSFVLLLSSLLYADKLIDTKIENAALKKYGTFAKNRFVAINKDLLQKLRSASDIKKLNTVNTWINFIHYKSDQQLYGVSDYWTT